MENQIEKGKKDMDTEFTEGAGLGVQSFAAQGPTLLTRWVVGNKGG